MPQSAVHVALDHSISRPILPVTLLVLVLFSRCCERLANKSTRWPRYVFLGTSSMSSCRSLAFGYDPTIFAVLGSNNITISVYIG
ncbi:hypothetical protein BJ322DRAFT_773090 [Thelephora terrestris]|uniref:Uncharacterized protein n=1 Tax=Thelephora terrestris TaxID=56493 RepID=A0A9P6L7L7_9AGAM|nr:hypothetical protein BJ322DRAFT_773090 [Thelephora terrestris]